jgi:hypothetical protein
MMVFCTMLANEAPRPAGLLPLLDQIDRVGVMAAFTLQRLIGRQLPLKPFGYGLWQNPAAVAKGAYGIKSAHNSLPNKSRFVRKAVKNVGQVLIHSKRYNRLFILGHVAASIEEYSIDPVSGTLLS